MIRSKFQFIFGKIFLNIQILKSFLKFEIFLEVLINLIFFLFIKTVHVDENCTILKDFHFSQFLFNFFNQIFQYLKFPHFCVFLNILQFLVANTFYQFFQFIEIFKFFIENSFIFTIFLNFRFTLQTSIFFSFLF